MMKELSIRGMSADVEALLAKLHRNDILYKVLRTKRSVGMTWVYIVEVDL